MKVAQFFPPSARPEEILAAGAEAASAYYELEAATTEITKIRNLRVFIAEWSGFAQPRASWFVSPVSIGDMNDLDRAEAAYAGAGEPFHSLARVGMILRLNQLDEVAEIETRIAEEREAARKQRSLAGFR